MHFEVRKQCTSKACCTVRENLRVPPVDEQHLGSPARSLGLPPSLGHPFKCQIYGIKGYKACWTIMFCYAGRMPLGQELWRA